MASPGVRAVAELCPESTATDADGCFIARSQTTDVEDQATGLQHWQQEFLQISRGRFSGCVEDFWFGNVQLFRDRCNQAVHQSGHPWPGSRTIAYAIEADGEGVFSGEPMRKEDLVTLADGQPLDFRTPRNIDCVAATVDSQALAEHAAQVWHSDASRGLPDSGRIVARPEVARLFTAPLCEVYAHIVGRPSILHYHHVRRNLEEQLLNAIVMLGAHAELFGRSTSLLGSKTRLVNRAKSLVLEREDHCVTVSDLCRQLSVSRRTLQYAFEVVCGMSPLSYIKVMRLNRVHRELRHQAGNAECSVGDVAARHGFWHQSRFASEYRKLFGELPSATLGKR